MIFGDGGLCRCLSYLCDPDCGRDLSYRVDRTFHVYHAGRPCNHGRRFPDPNTYHVGLCRAYRPGSGASLNDLDLDHDNLVHDDPFPCRYVCCRTGHGVCRDLLNFSFCLHCSGSIWRQGSLGLIVDPMMA